MDNLILGIETSCDDTSVALVNRDGKVKALETVSQYNIHSDFGGVFPELASRAYLEAMLPVVVDIKQEIADKAALDFGFDNSTSDWHNLIDNPEIDIIDITAPNVLHKEMALAAIAAGKHVYCEKPLTLTIGL